MSGVNCHMLGIASIDEAALSGDEAVDVTAHGLIRVFQRRIESGAQAPMLLEAVAITVGRLSANDTDAA